MTWLTWLPSVKNSFFHLRVSLHLCTAIRQNRHKPRGFFQATTAGLRSAGFQTGCIADFQVGRTPAVVQSAGLETRDTADLEVCAIGVAVTSRCASALNQFPDRIQFVKIREIRVKASGVLRFI
jgi:hypothetical protein